MASLKDYGSEQWRMHRQLKTWDTVYYFELSIRSCGMVLQRTKLSHGGRAPWHPVANFATAFTAHKFYVACGWCSGWMLTSCVIDAMAWKSPT